MDISDDVTGSLRAQERGHAPVIFQSAGFCTEHSAKARGVGFEDEKSPTLRAGVVPGAVVYDARGNGSGDTVSTITGDHNGHISDYTALAVAYDCRNHAAAPVSATLQAKSNGGQSLNYINPISDGYVVRRLTPQECALLQGFPADYCAGLETPEPTEAEISFWSEVWETHRRIVGTSTKPKTRNQLVKWLRNPHSDSAEYRLWGNGVALPCVCFVMAGIREVAGS